MFEQAADLVQARKRRGTTTLPADRPRRITPRELEVLALIADGRSTKEIARALWITEETVRTHVRRILDRLDARTRAHAVSIAYCEDLWARDREAG